MMLGSIDKLCDHSNLARLNMGFALQRNFHL